MQSKLTIFTMKDLCFTKQFVYINATGHAYAECAASDNTDHLEVRALLTARYMLLKRPCGGNRVIYRSGEHNCWRILMLLLRISGTMYALIVPEMILYCHQSSFSHVIPRSVPDHLLRFCTAIAQLKRGTYVMCPPQMFRHVFLLQSPGNNEAPDTGVEGTRLWLGNLPEVT